MPARNRSELTDSAGNSLATTTSGTAVLKVTSVNPFNSRSFTVTWPTTVQAVYRFYSGASATGTLLKTITLNFATAQTPDLTSGEFV